MVALVRGWPAFDAGAAAAGPPDRLKTSHHLPSATPNAAAILGEVDLLQDSMKKENSIHYEIFWITNPLGLSV